MATVRFENVTKKSKILCPIYNLNIEFKDKEFTSILGPSGAGKTTILRLIAGLEVPDEGEIYIDDELVNVLQPNKRNVAMVFQSYALYPNASAYNNIASPLLAENIPEDEIKERVEKVARILHISDLLEKLPTQLSGGEMQRVAIGRAMIRKPKVYLFDEPLSNLDAKLRVHMRAQLKRLQMDLGQTLIYTTHDEVEALSMSDKILIINKGIRQQFDSPQSIYANPLNLFVANFIGTPSINLIDCTVEKKKEKLFADAGEFKLDLTPFENSIQKNSTSNELVLGIRPRYLGIHNEKIGKNSVESEIYETEWLGSTMIVIHKIGDLLLKSRIKPTVKLSPQQKVWASFNLDRIHIFDKKSGKTIV